ncbi:hypothetical protein QE152_g38233 [Popillia japonica]|uniref:Uncharacterized protein n=1 Tax=Popillia japonica TaxID=7064 RepID=A0AAW1I8F3_POPJA
MQICRRVFRDNNILTLASVYISECVVVLRENTEFFSTQRLIHKYNTRGIQSKIFLPPQATKSWVSRSVIANIINVYNRLPGELRNVPYLTFKKELHIYLARKVYYNIDDFLLEHGDISNQHPFHDENTFAINIPPS